MHARQMPVRDPAPLNDLSHGIGLALVNRARRRLPLRDSRPVDATARHFLLLEAARHYRRSGSAAAHTALSRSEHNPHQKASNAPCCNPNRAGEIAILEGSDLRKLLGLTPAFFAQRIRLQLFEIIQTGLRDPRPRITAWTTEWNTRKQDDNQQCKCYRQKHDRSSEEPQGCRPTGMELPESSHFSCLGTNSTENNSKPS